MKKISKYFFTNKKIQENIIVMFGVPGVGKGTYGGMLAEDLQYYKITPGDLIRKNIKNNGDDPTVKVIKATIDQGKFVPDQLV